MKAFKQAGFNYDGDKLLILDQSKLPHEEKWLLCEAPAHMVEMIKSLQVRGAPMIGIGAVLSIIDYIAKGASIDEVHAAARELRKARPTAVNLQHAIDRVALKEQNLQSIRAKAEKWVESDWDSCQKMAELGSALIQDGDSLITHCNAGALATGGVGTALGVMTEAWRQGKRFHVYVDETRPLLQGARLTTWELKKLGIPHTLICDSMAAMLMAQGKIQKAFVGADRIAANGDFANKIGTYSLALAAHYHKIPFYVIAPSTTVDEACLQGDAIPIEQRSADEVRGSITGENWSPEGVPVYNPAFDVTPFALVTSIITENGKFRPFCKSTTPV